MTLMLPEFGSLPGTGGTRNPLKVGDTVINIGFEEQDLTSITNKTPGEGTENLYRTTPEEYRRTGNLKRGFRIIDGGASIINNIPYSAFVELGTSKMEGHFMVTRSLEEIEEGLEVRLLKELQSKKIMSDIHIKCRIGI